MIEKPGKNTPAPKQREPLQEPIHQQSAIPEFALAVRIRIRPDSSDPEPKPAIPGPKLLRLHRLYAVSFIVDGPIYF